MSPSLSYRLGRRQYTENTGEEARWGRGMAVASRAGLKTICGAVIDRLLLPLGRPPGTTFADRGLLSEALIEG